MRRDGAGIELTQGMCQSRGCTPGVPVSGGATRSRGARDASCSIRDPLRCSRAGANGAWRAPVCERERHWLTEMRNRSMRVHRAASWRRRRAQGE
ncbi:hypothetical protein WT36_07840 [Burkholderia territorii]|nr:hypothetical protein WT36_07840 [Burkholderia territorii]